MKIVTIPDLHGKDVWNEINPENYDKIVFVGDYVDAPYRKVSDVADVDNFGYKIPINEIHGRTNGEILYNLNNIIAFKDKYPDKVVLILGNHDMPYVYHIKNRSIEHEIMCSRHRYGIENELAKLFNDNISKFQIAYQVKNTLWSHAGITQEAYLKYFNHKIDNFDEIADELNRWFILDRPELFHIAYLRGGRSSAGSILWADKSEWMIGQYELPLTQIVGHSHVEDISFFYDEVDKDENRLTTEILSLKINAVFTDVLNVKTKFYELEL